MSDKEKKTKANTLDIPNSICIKGYEMKFKDTLANDYLSYRCLHRKCRTLLTISKEELKKLSIEDPNIKIKYTINKEHSCSNTKINKETNIKECITDTQLYKNAKNLIDTNLEKPLNWHIKNLLENNIKLNKKKIENILYKDKEEKYPADDEILEFLENITITLDEKNEELIDLPFCYGEYKFINFTKKNRVERFIIFTSKYQLKQFILADEIYIDATFRCSPKGYNQSLNIIALNKNAQFHLPVFFIHMTNKSYYSYHMLFSIIKEILENHNLKFINENTMVMTDFELSLRKAIKELFPKFNLKGCYFHYIKIFGQKRKK